MLSGEEFIEDETQRVDVAAGGDALPGKLLGSHVARRSRHYFFLVDGLAESSQTEIGDLGASPADDHDIGRFQIAVQDSLNVCCRKTGAELEVVGPIDFPHPSFSQWPHNPIAIGEHGPRQEATALP